MTTQIILLRGVMPVGKNKVPMALLRPALEKAGLTKVRTYIASGNVLAATDLAPRAVETLAHDVIAREFGGDISVLARPAAYFRKALTQNPFKKADPAQMYFTLLSGKPKADLLKAFLAEGCAPDQLRVVGDMIYVRCATKYSDLKVNNNFIERKLKLRATTRVYNTIANLVRLAEDEVIR